MASLNGKDINNTYQGLVKSLDNDEIATMTQLTDGLGNALALSVGTAAGTQGINVCGNVVTTGNINVGNALNVNGITTFSDTVNISDKNLTVTGSGNVLINGSLTANAFNLQGNGVFSGTTTMYQPLSVSSTTVIGDASTLNTQAAALSVNGNTTVTGDLSVMGDIIAFFDQYSDLRLKENIQSLDSKIYFDKLNAYTFDWNEQSGQEGSGKGFIAQEVAEVDPSLVSDRKEYLKVDYVSFIPILFAEIQKLRKEVDELKAQI